MRARDGAELLPSRGVIRRSHRLDDDTTRVTLQMDVDPEGPIENIGVAIGALDRRGEGDLDRFKQFIESRAGETGAWRGEVASPSHR